MDPFAILTVAVGLPFAIGGYLLTRAYCRALRSRPEPKRYSRRASLMTSLSDDEERDLRAVIDAGTTAACLAASTVIIS